MNPIHVYKNKNPLFSSAVTGGFEEFTGSGIVLAAAGKKANEWGHKILFPRFTFIFVFVLIQSLFCDDTILGRIIN